jgi:hypothetical protein
MKRMLIGSLMAVAFAAVTAAQTATPPPAQQQQQQQQAQPQTPQTQPQTAAKPTEVTLVGCVVKGSTQKIFLFENAIDPAKKDEKGKTYLLVFQPDQDLSTHLNHKIQIVGLAQDKVVVVTPPATVVAEKDLPTFTIKTITMVADTCS